MCNPGRFRCNRGYPNNACLKRYDFQMAPSYFYNNILSIEKIELIKETGEILRSVQSGIVLAYL